MSGRPAGGASAPGRGIRRATAAALLACAAPAAAAGTQVTIADSGDPASRVVAELAAQALGAQGYTVTRVGQPSAQTADAAVRAGAADAYATGTATLLERVLARPKERDDATLRAALGPLLAGRGQAALAIAPYDDAPQVACTRAAIRRHRLTGIVALPRAAPRLTYAANAAHIVRADGLAALRARFRRVVVSPGAGRFDLLARGRAHCVLSSGIEPRAARLPVVALRDRTRRLAGTPQHGVVVASQAYLAGAPASFTATLERVAALLTAQNARALVAQTELDGLDPAAAAQAFLRANGVI